jgi:hypothetical protein
VDLVLSPLATTLHIDPRLLFVGGKDSFARIGGDRWRALPRARAPDLSDT